MSDHYGGQKRRRDDDDEYDNRRSRMPRVANPRRILERLRREIVEIGEPSRFKVSQMMHHLGRGLGSIDMDEVRSGALDTIVAVMVEQPHKIPLLAGAVQIANFDSPLMGQSVVEMCHSKLEHFIAQAMWTHVKVFVRFLSALSPIVEGEGVIKLLTTLIEHAVKMQHESASRSGAAEEIYVAVLLALPFYLKSGERQSTPNPKLVEKVEEVVKLSEGFEFKTDEAQLDLVSPFFTPNGERDKEQLPYRPQEFIKLVKAGIDKLASEQEWQVTKLIDVDAMVRLLPEAETRIEEQQLHTFPALNIPAQLKDQPTKMYQFPRLFFRAYLPKVVETMSEPLDTVPQPDTFEAVIFRDITSDIINAMDFNRKEVARQLITLDLFFAPPTFAKPGISLDKLENVDPGTSTWKVEDVALEGVLDHIFNLPRQYHRSAYYDAILMEACIMAPQAIAPVFGRSIRFLYSNLEYLDAEVIQSYLEWFSHHLSNFSFTWKWQEWLEDAGLDALHPKRVFIKELILKEVRLCYADRIKDTLPPEFVQFVPHISEEVQFKYLEPNGPYYEVVTKLINFMRDGGAAAAEKPGEAGDEAQQQDAVEDPLDTVMNEIKEKITSEGVGGDAAAIDKSLIDIIASTICYLGSRSLSHAENWVGRTGHYITKILDTEQLSEQQQQDLADCVLQFWHEQPYIGLTVVGYFVRYKIVSEWVLLASVLQDQQLLITNHGHATIVRTIESRLTSEQLRVELVRKLLVRLVQDRASTEGTSWLAWWYDNYIRAFARRYHELLPEDVPELDINVVNQARKLPKTPAPEPSPEPAPQAQEAEAGPKADNESKPHEQEQPDAAMAKAEDEGEPEPAAAAAAATNSTTDGADSTTTSQ